MAVVPILSALIVLPLAGAVLLLLVRNRGHERDAAIQWIALGVSLAEFAASLWMWFRFDPARPDFQMVERADWIPSFGIQYAVGVDGISLFLVVLTGFLTPLALLGSWRSVHKKVREFSFFMLALESAMIGVFLSLDMFLFYVFWDAMLIPMYFLIGIWGYERRVYAAVKFILYTMAGSVLMLVAILTVAYLHSAATGAYSFNYEDWLNLAVPRHTQVWLFLAFAVAFAIKVPLFPFHTWLPDAHVEAPTAGSVILAAVLLFPDAAVYFSPALAVLAVTGIVYGALVAMVQPDMKKLVAYSSVSHLGFVVLGITAMNVQGVQGAVYQMLNHGVSTGALFLIVGMLSDRRHTRLISEYGGLKHVVPKLVAAFFVVTLSSIGLPGLNGFVGEFLILFGAFQWSPALTAVAASGVILSAVYMLWMFQRVNYGAVTNPKNEGMQDLDTREKWVLWPAIAMAVFMGVAPWVFLKPMTPAVNRIVARMAEAEPAKVVRAAAPEPAAGALLVPASASDPDISATENVPRSFSRPSSGR
jgi:NADH-quinone oxidoreductase subunit M